MSVEKFSDNTVFNYEENPYAQISVKVIQSIRCPITLAIWVYLATKPKDWKIIKQHLKNHFGIGNNKIKCAFSYLKLCNLITYSPVKCANGRFTHWEITILNGSKFINYQEDEKLSTECTTGSKTIGVDLHMSGSGKLHIIENTNNRKKLLSASRDARDKSFEEFWKAYPVKKNKVRARKSWGKLKPEDIAAIMLDIGLRKAKDVQWQDIQYIPHATTYLNGRRWEDEIVEQKRVDKSNNYTNSAKQTEIRSTVREWAPGHPGYDSLHGIRRQLS